jgi:copper/silver efflux system protein
MQRLTSFLLARRFIVWVLLLLLLGWGWQTAPFDGGVWRWGNFERDPVPVDAIPNIGENQQIVFTEWMGRSPQDVEDQVTYPLTVSLLGLPGVRTIRSYSYFGFSTVYVIFEDDVEFYWSRSRLLEKLSSLPRGTLPSDANPTLGPDATALGQVYWYTLEGRDAEGNPTGGWDLHELRSVQDWQVRYALMATPGIAEVASAGGYLREYQIDVNPDAMHAHRVSLQQVYQAVRNSNREVGAKVVELNRAEYFMRGLGWVEELEDLEQAVIRSVDGVAVRIADVAHVTLGPAQRRGALDKGGAEAVGGVAVVQHGANPLQALQGLKKKIAEISPGLPRKTLANGVESQLTIVPFYDRSGLIQETLGTLEKAISEEVLVTIMVVLLLLMRWRAALLVSATLPIVVLLCFVCMKLAGVDANIVALSGIAIAIGTIVDVAIVLTENIQQRLDDQATSGPQLHVRAATDPQGTTPHPTLALSNRIDAVRKAVGEVGPALVTAILTTVIGFLPVFSMTGAEGKLFQPLAWTKTFALIGSAMVAILVLPTLAVTVLRPRAKPKQKNEGLLSAVFRPTTWVNLALFAIVGWYLASHWAPLGIERPATNFAFVLILVGGLLVAFRLFERAYPTILTWCLRHKALFLTLPAAIVIFGAASWLGWKGAFQWLPRSLNAIGLPGDSLEQSQTWQSAEAAFPGLGREFMPPLDEGSFLYMPTTAPHASIGEALDVLRKLDMAILSVPEVRTAVGKIGRADSALDPAPVSMIETIIEIKPEYQTDADGKLHRNWRDHIHSMEDVWDEILSVTKLPGVTSAPWLQPIGARLVMLQTGMRAPMGVKVLGPDLATIEKVALQIEEYLKQVPSVNAATVFADRVIGKPYLEFDIDRAAAARHGVSVAAVLDVLETALGGKTVTYTVEGRERYPVRVRYPRERRNDLHQMQRVLVPLPSGAQIPLNQLATLRYTQGPQAIKTEDTFPVAYVIFDRKPGRAEVDVVEDCQAFLSQKMENDWQLPAGVSYRFAGSYEHQLRASRTLAIVLPLALALILVVLYLQFRAIATTLMVFSGVFVAWAGGFLLLWLYANPNFLNFEVAGTAMRDLFQIGPRNLSVAVWVGFLALFGIATDDGVLIGTYIRQTLKDRRPQKKEDVRAAVLEAGRRRCRPCLMTTATTLLALLPVLSSTGRGADVMVPMALPSFGGMLIAIITMFVVPVLSCAVEERRLKKTSASKP